MQDTFRNLGIGLVLAQLLIYFLMVALFKSYITPLVVLSAVPIGVVGVVHHAVRHAARRSTCSRCWA